MALVFLDESQEYSLSLYGGRPDLKLFSCSETEASFLALIF